MNQRDYFALSASRDAIPAFAPVLDATQVKRAGDRLIEILVKSTDNSVRNLSADAIAALAPRLDAAQVTVAGDRLIEILDESDISRDHDVSQATITPLATLAPRLDAVQIARAWDKLIELLPKSRNGEVLSATATVLIALEPRLDASQVSRAWHTLLEIRCEPPSSSGYDWCAARAYKPLVALVPRLERSDVSAAMDALMSDIRISHDEDLFVAKAEILAALATRATVEKRIEALEWLFNTLNDHSPYSETWIHYAHIVSLLNTNAAESYASKAILSLLADFASDENFTCSEWYSPRKFMGPSIIALQEPRSVVAFLFHPGSCEEPQEILLQRFEELVFHEGRHVYLVPESEDKQSDTDHAKRRESPPRRFHTVHDAAAWIQENWPDFDLESTMPVQWPVNSVAQSDDCAKSVRSDSASPHHEPPFN